MSDETSGFATSYDVVVVGGRVAGALTATLFARFGCSVIVVDRAHFPSPTLSTHFFRGNGLIRVLDDAGALDDVLALGSPPLTGEYNYGDGERQGTRGPPQDPGDAGYCLSVRRDSLDATLLDCARRAGAVVRTSAHVSGVLVESGRAVGVVLADGSVVRAELVVGADGRRSLVAAEVEAPDLERYQGKRALYYRYVRGMPGPFGEAAENAEFSQIGDELAYVFPSDMGLSCVAISINLDEFERLRHDARNRFDTLLKRHTGLWRRYADSIRHGRLYGSGPQDDFVRQAAGPGWALVGDSGLHQDPWSGLGMDSAGVAAATLVDCVIASGGLANRSTWTQTYADARNEALLDWFHSTVSGAADLAAI